MTSASSDRKERHAYYKDLTHSQIEEMEHEDSREAAYLYMEERRANSRTWQTLNEHVRTLKYLASHVPEKGLPDFEKRDIVSWIASVSDDYAETTMARMKVAIKDFYKNLDGGDEYPENVKWLNTTTSSNNKKDPDVLLKQEDIKSMVKAADHPRDKAIIAALYESGARAGEFLSLNVKNVELDKHGAIVRLNPDEGALKTGTRRIRLIHSDPYITQWLENHPDGDNQEAPLWPSLYKETRLTNNGLTHVVKKYAKKSGIGKNVYPHLFRHSRATELAKQGFTESDLKIMMGWTGKSDMPDIYIHMSGADVEEKILRFHGLIDEEGDAEPEPMEPWTCPRPNCGFKNPADNRFCGRCTLARDVKAAEDISKAKDKTSKDLMDLIDENPAVFELYQELVKEAQKNKVNV